MGLRVPALPSAVPRPSAEQTIHDPAFASPLPDLRRRPRLLSTRVVAASAHTATGHTQTLAAHPDRSRDRRQRHDAAKLVPYQRRDQIDPRPPRLDRPRRARAAGIGAQRAAACWCAGRLGDAKQIPTAACRSRWRLAACSRTGTQGQQVVYF